MVTPFSAIRLRIQRHACEYAQPQGDRIGPGNVVEGNLVATTDRDITISQELFDAAARASAREGRSVGDQLEHWAQVGRSVSELNPVIRQRVDRALAGELAPEDLHSIEEFVFNVEIEAGIATRLTKVDFAERRAKRGLTSVAMNGDGELVEYLPDGSIRPVKHP